MVFHREVHEHVTVPREFVYVYDLPEKFNKDVTELPTLWHPEQYDIDQVIPDAFYFWMCNLKPAKKDVQGPKPHCTMRQGG